MGLGKEYFFGYLIALPRWQVRINSLKAEYIPVPGEGPLVYFSNNNTAEEIRCIFDLMIIQR